MADEHDTQKRTESESCIFNENAICPKCGYGFVSARHKKASKTGPERIDRTCERCRFTWPEHCIDSPKGEGES